MPTASVCPTTFEPTIGGVARVAGAIAPTTSVATEYAFVVPTEFVAVTRMRSRQP